MKKILLVLAAILVTGCGEPEYIDSRLTDDPKMKEISVSKFSVLVDLTFEGESHQYVFYEKGYEGSLSHWEGCKYCKQRNKNEQD